MIKVNVMLILPNCLSTQPHLKWAEIPVMGTQAKELIKEPLTLTFFLVNFFSDELYHRLVV